MRECSTLETQYVTRQNSLPNRPGHWEALNGHTISANTPRYSTRSCAGLLQFRPPQTHHDNTRLNTPTTWCSNTPLHAFLVSSHRCYIEVDNLQQTRTHFQKFKSRLRILRAKRVTRSELQTQDPKILGATVKMQSPYNLAPSICVPLTYNALGYTATKQICRLRTRIREENSMAYFWTLTRGSGAQNLVRPKRGSRRVTVRLPADCQLHDQLNVTSFGKHVVRPSLNGGLKNYANVHKVNHWEMVSRYKYPSQ
jgi:hypothetical protein